MFGINRLSGYFTSYDIKFVDYIYLVVISFVIVYSYFIDKSYRLNVNLIKVDLTKLETVIMVVLFFLTLAYIKLFYSILFLILIIILRFDKK
ncbi:MAG: hypothetical protein N3C60_00360 [Calditerrivibrio sp.]|nr:hypothetical protein [Calditerrivibrio sp.]